MRTRFVHKSKARQRGLSLLELMIALAISMVVLFAVISIYLPTKLNTRLQSGMSRINQNISTVTELVARDIRQTANIGCSTLSEGKLSNDSFIAENKSRTIQLSVNNVIRVLPASTVSGAIGPVIEVRHAADDGAHLAEDMKDRGGPILMTSDPNVKNSALPVVSAIISNCQTSEEFQIDNSNKSGTQWRIVPSHTLRVRYAKDSRVAPLQYTRYFVRNDDRADGEISTLALYKSTAAADGTWDTKNNDAIAHDIVSMDAKLELDTNGDFQADNQISYDGSGYSATQITGVTLLLTFETPKNIKGTDGKRVQRTATTAINIRARVT